MSESGRQVGCGMLTSTSLPFTPPSQRAKPALSPIVRRPAERSRRRRSCRRRASRALHACIVASSTRRRGATSSSPLGPRVQSRQVPYCSFFASTPHACIRAQQPVVRRAVRRRARESRTDRVHQHLRELRGLRTAHALVVDPLDDGIAGRIVLRGGGTRGCERTRRRRARRQSVMSASLILSPVCPFEKLAVLLPGQHHPVGRERAVGALRRDDDDLVAGGERLGRRLDLGHRRVRRNRDARAIRRRTARPSSNPCCSRRCRSTSAMPIAWRRRWSSESRPAIMRLPSPRPRSASGKMWISVARSLPSGCLTVVTPMKVLSFTFASALGAAVVDGHRRRERDGLATAVGGDDHLVRRDAGDRAANHRHRIGGGRGRGRGAGRGGLWRRRIDDGVLGLATGAERDGRRDRGHGDRECWIDPDHAPNCMHEPCSCRVARAFVIPARSARAVLLTQSRKLDDLANHGVTAALDTAAPPRSSTRSPTRFASTSWRCCSTANAASAS